MPGRGELMNRVLVASTREPEGREASPTAGVPPLSRLRRRIDSQSVKTTESGGVSGYLAATLDSRPFERSHPVFRVFEPCPALALSSRPPIYRFLVPVRKNGAPYPYPKRTIRITL